MIVKAAPNMCFGVSLLVFILDTNTYNSTMLGVYEMPRARIWMQGIDKWAGANCQCEKLVKNMDIVSLPKCTATKNDEVVKGLLSQQVCEMLNYCVTISMFLTSFSHWQFAPAHLSIPCIQILALGIS